MQFTKQQKIYVAVLGVAGLAFLADRLLFGAKPVSAQPTPASLLISPLGGTKKPLPANAFTGDSGLGNFSGLSERLAKAAAGIDLEHIKDPFRPSAAWAGEGAAKSDAATTPSAETRFRQRHKLLAVMRSARGGLAIVDGKTVRRGQVFDGFQLSEVHDRSATFSADGASVDLELEQGKGLDPKSDNTVIMHPPAGPSADLR